MFGLVVSDIVSNNVNSCDIYLIHILVSSGLLGDDEVEFIMN